MALAWQLIDDRCVNDADQEGASPTPPAPGKALERLVATLERVLAAKSRAVTIKSPKMVPDRVTGQPREHDIVLTLREGHHTIVVAIECKDWSRPVGTEAVEAFGTKCRDTLIDKGVIVSPSGFTRPARDKAEHMGIRCLDLERADRFDWLGVGQIQIQQVHIPRIDMIAIPAGPVAIKPTRFQILDTDGNPVPAAVLEANVRNSLSGVQLPPGPVRRAIRILTPGFHVLDLDRLERHPIVRIDAAVEIVTKVTWAPFEKVVYQDKTGSGVISQAAIAELSIGDIKGNLVFSNEGSAGTQIAFVITKPPGAAPDAASQTVFEAPRS